MQAVIEEEEEDGEGGEGVEIKEGNPSKDSTVSEPSLAAGEKKKTTVSALSSKFLAAKKKGRINSLVLARGETIWAAAAAGNMAKIKQIVINGGHPDLADAQGQTALHHAVVHHQEKAVEFLLESGGNANLKDLKGDSALDLARKSKNEKIISMLVDGGAIDKRFRIDRSSELKSLSIAEEQE